MPSFRTLALLSPLFAVMGCHRHYAPPETPMPPNTILLSQMMRELSAQPGFTEAMLKQLDGTENAQPNGKKQGPALMTPRLVDDLRTRILGKDWSGLDRFPGWTMREINPTVRAIGHEAGKSDQLEDASAVHPGAPLGSAASSGKYLDLGPYALDKAETLSLDKQSGFTGLTSEVSITILGYGVSRGDSANQTESVGEDSKRLVDILNRLAVNNLQGAQPFTATIARVAHSSAASSRMSGEESVPPSEDQPSTSPQQLIAALQASGHTVTITDSRYFANFGHFHYNARGSGEPAQDVMMPFWIDSQIIIPNSGGRHLLLPVSHAELEWHIHGPILNADVAYYFGVDGKSEWRTMDTLDQAWVLKRDARIWTGADAVEVTRLTAALTVAYMHLHDAHPHLPFGGYYALGVCQDGVSAIEHKMTGKTTLFPNTADDTFFTDPRDAEINALIAAIPKDRSGKRPGPERIFGSLPTAPDASGRFDAITIPGLADDLNATYAAWQSGSLRRPHTLIFYIGLAAVIGTLLLVLQRRRQR